MSFKGRIRRTINDADTQGKYLFCEGRGGGHHRELDNIFRFALPNNLFICKQCISSKRQWEDLSGFLATSMPDWRGFARSGF